MVSRAFGATEREAGQSPLDARKRPSTVIVGASHEILSIMFGFTRNIITVAFVDDTSGKVVSSSKMRLERLPDTFAVDTALNMGGSRYVVISAEPNTKAEFTRTKHLKVAVRKQAVPGA